MADNALLGFAQAVTGSTGTDLGILMVDASARMRSFMSSVSSTGLISIIGGVKVPVIAGSGATVALTAAQSGSICLFDRAAGIAYTLPAPQVGLSFTFLTTVTRTSNAESIATDVAGTKLLGNVLNTIDTGVANISCFGNGTSHVILSMNGTTTGGILGSQLFFTCVSATIWNVTGIINGSGSIATPFASIMNLLLIQKRIYRRCGLSDTPATADATRILDFINEWYREVLAMPGIDQCRDTTLSLTTVASQSQYGIPQAISRVRYVFDVSNQRRIQEASLDWLRQADPGLRATSSTLDYWIPLNGWGAVAQPLTTTGVPLYVVSDSASDGAGVTAHVETTRLGGVRAGDTLKAMNGTTRAQFGTKSDHIEVSKFYLSTAATGTVSLYDAAASGNLLAQITPGRTNARYFMLQFWPTISAVTTLSIDCQRAIEDLTNPTEEPLLHEDYHWLLVYGPLSDELAKRDSTQASMYANRATKILSAMRHSLYGNPDEIAVQRGPTGALGISRLGNWFQSGS